MHLERLELRQFRNYPHLRCELNPRLNVFVGRNAQGKSNLVESIYYLGNLKSFRLTTSRRVSDDLIRSGEERALISASLRRDALVDDIAIELHRSKKREIRLNASSFKGKMSEFFQRLMVVSFTPDDLFLIKGSPERRRSYLDRLIFYCRPEFLDRSLDYSRIIDQKNAFLKQRRGSDGELALWNEQLVTVGTEIIRERLTMIQRLQPVLSGIARGISNATEEISLHYQSGDRIIDPGHSAGSISDALRSDLTAASGDEQRLGKSLVGPHLDDMRIDIHTETSTGNIRWMGSQGQMRTAVLSLRLAQVQLVEESRGHKPILILDDILSEFDSIRNEYVVKTLAAYHGQIFVTCVDWREYRNALDSTGPTVREVSSGAFL